MGEVENGREEMRDREDDIEFWELVYTRMDGWKVRVAACAHESSRQVASKGRRGGRKGG